MLTVISLPRQPRAYVAAMLLVVQVLGLGHVALARHTINENGAVVDVEPLALETHDDEAGHLCAGDVAIHADAPDDCLVLAGFAAPSLVPAVVSHRRTPEALLTGLQSSSFTFEQLDALSRAPKASPPQG